MEIFRSQTGPDIPPPAFLFEVERDLVVLCILSGMNILLLRRIAIIDHFFDLMFDLFFANRTIIIRRIF